VTGRGRGQTQQDFAVGISVFLLAVTFTFAFVPTTLSPAGGQTESDAYRADRVASELMAEATLPGEANTLNRTAWTTDLATTGEGDLARRYNLTDTTQVNATLRRLDGGTPAFDTTAGDVYNGRGGAAASRIVRYDGDRYRLLVRVW
jgi:hypothetical protein